METWEIKKLQILSAKIRLDILKMLEHRGYGHMGGSLSIVETLSVLYGKVLHYDIKNPKDRNRDIVVLSKGHAGPALYAALSNVSFFEEELLNTLNDGHTLLPSHPDKNKVPGVDATTGSLGQGCSQAAGIATAIHLKEQDRYVYLIVGDGELNEGQCWEAFQYLAHYKYHRCIVLIDENKRQLDGYTKDVMNPFDILKKMEAFGFYTQRVKGNQEEMIYEAIMNAKQHQNEAVCIVLDTIKGQGVPYYEAMFANHSVKFDKDEIIQANHQAIAFLTTFLKEGTVCNE